MYSILSELYNKKIIVYGTGQIGRLVIPYLIHETNIDLLGCCVSDVKWNKVWIQQDIELPVRSIQEWKEFESDAVILIATSKKFFDEITANCKKAGFQNVVPMWKGLIDNSYAFKYRMICKQYKDFLAGDAGSYGQQVVVESGTHLLIKFSSAYQHADRSPMVSIIIPVYNTEEYLRDCLDSALNQTLREIEIICVDDGSTDGSWSVLEEYYEKDDRVTIIRTENNGQSFARNLGLEYAQGNYVWFSDSDDLLIPSAAEALYAYAQEKDIDVLFFNADTFFMTEELQQKFSNFSGAYQAKKDYSEIRTGQKLFYDMENGGDYSVSPCLQFIKADYLKKHNITFPNGIIHEDAVFTFQNVLQARSAARINETYYLRRIRDNSVMTSEKSYKHFSGYLNCLILMIGFLESQELEDTAKVSAQKTIISIYNTLAQIYQELSDVEKDKIKNGNRLEKYSVYLMSQEHGKDAFFKA